MSVYREVSNVPWNSSIMDLFIEKISSFILETHSGLHPFQIRSVVREYDIYKKIEYAR